MRRALRITAWSLAGVLLLAVVLIAGLLILGNTQAGRHLIERETAQLTSGRVRIDGFGGRFPGAISIARLEMRDAQGLWMTAERVSVRWSPLALLGWDLHVERFGVGRVEVARKPVSSPASSSTSSSRFSLPTIDIDQIVIDLLDLEPAAAGLEAQLNVTGSAHYQSAQNLRANLDARRTNGRGTYAVALRLTPARMYASLDLDEPAGGPLEHLTNLPGLGALSVTARLEGPRSAESLRLSAQAGELRADANGTVDLVHRAADLTYSVNSPAMTPRPGLSWMRIAIEGRWRGPLSAPHADSVLDLQGVALPNGAQLARLAATLNADGRLLTVRATADGIMLPSSEPQLLEGSPLKLDAALRLDAPGRPLKLNVSHRLLDLSANAVTSGMRSAAFTLRLPDIAEFASLFKENLHGRVELTGNLAERGATMGVDVTGSGDLGGPSLPAQLLGANTRLHLAAALTDATVRIQSLEVNGRTLSMSASGTADRSQGAAQPAGASKSATSSSAIRAVNVRWQIALSDLSVLSRSVNGSLETSGMATGPLQSIATDVRVRSKLSVSGSPPGTLEATLQARGLPSAPSGTVRASGTLIGAPLRLDASLEQVQANTYHISVRRTAWKSLSANGDLTAGRSLAADRGNLRVSIGSLADLKELVGMSLAGSIDATVALTPGAKRGRANIELDARNVVASGIQGNAKLSATGPIDALRIELAAQSPNIGGEPASLTSAARLDGAAKQVALERFEAHYHGQTVRLLSPSRVLFAKGLTVRNLRLGAQQAIVAVDGELSPGLNLRASVRDVNAALVNAFVPHMLTDGTFNAQANLHGSRSAPVGSASFEVAGLKLVSTAAQGLPPIDARGSARFRGSSANVSAQLRAGTQSQFTASGRVPFDSAATAALKLSGHIDAALMNAFLEARGERAAGTISLDARVAGTAQAPKIEGTVLLKDGDLRDYSQGIHLERINARLVGGQGVLKIESMTATAGPGQLSAQGTVGVLKPGMPVSIEIKAHRIQPITNDILTANLDANMQVSGTLRQRMDVTGKLHVNRAAITIPNGFPPNVAVLEVVTPGEAAQAGRAPRAAGLIIGLDLKLEAPESIFVQGRGLDAQLGGNLEVTGTSDNPQVSGGFRMIRGSFSLAGTQLMFTSGRVTFNGEGLRGTIDPTLDFLAQASVTYNAEATTVKLHVTGFADAPKLELTSTPQLPQDDLLALLLFGKPASQLSAVQLAEVGGGLASLGGIGGGSGGGGGTLSKLNPLNWAKRVFGLNTLSVGGGSPPSGAAPGGGTQSMGASVTAGKYVSNRVYVAATQSTSGWSQVQVDVDLTQHLKLQTRLGNGSATAQGTTPQNDPGNAIGLSWQYQY